VHQTRACCSAYPGPSVHLPQFISFVPPGRGVLAPGRRSQGRERASNIYAFTDLVFTRNIFQVQHRLDYLGLGLSVKSENRGKVERSSHNHQQPLARTRIAPLQCKGMAAKNFKISNRAAICAQSELHPKSKKQKALSCSPMKTECSRVFFLICTTH